MFDIENVAEHIIIINYKEIKVMFNELNNGRRTVKEGIDTKKYVFVPLRDFIGKVIKVDGFFFTNSKYGKQAVVVGNGCNINMPKSPFPSLRPAASRRPRRPSTSPKQRRTE